jgi:hypothetical protein
MTNQTPCNYRTPHKPDVQYYDEQMVIVNGVSYTRKEPTPIVIHEDENTIVIDGIKYQKVEEPKPQTLSNVIYNWKYETYDPSCTKLIVMIDEWLSKYNCDYVVNADYLQGYNALMDILKANLK